MRSRRKMLAVLHAPIGWRQKFWVIKDSSKVFVLMKHSGMMRPRRWTRGSWRKFSRGTCGSTSGLFVFLPDIFVHGRTSAKVEWCWQVWTLVWAFLFSLRGSQVAHEGRSQIGSRERTNEEEMMSSLFRYNKVFVSPSCRKWRLLRWRDLMMVSNRSRRSFLEGKNCVAGRVVNIYGFSVLGWMTRFFVMVCGGNVFLCNPECSSAKNVMECHDVSCYLLVQSSGNVVHVLVRIRWVFPSYCHVMECHDVVCCEFRMSVSRGFGSVSREISCLFTWIHSICTVGPAPVCVSCGLASFLDMTPRRKAAVIFRGSCCDAN